MKIVILNGSPRKGNTVTAIGAFAESAGVKNEIEIIDTDSLDIKGCKGCGSCECVKGCVMDDDTNMVVDKLVAADMILFATPVYWWGVTAQIKTVIDKCYSKGELLKNKKIGCIVIGEDEVEALQYRLIQSQFECIAQYLSWEILFHRSYSAGAKDDLLKNEEVIRELRSIGESI